MPQFDSTFFSAQIFWTIVSFALLLIVLSRWILPRIASILQQRASLIEAEIKAAQLQHQQADMLKKDYANKLSNIEKEAKKIFDASDKRLIQQRRQRMVEWDAEMERKKQTFKTDTSIIRQQAIRDVRNQSADLIIAATEQLIQQKVQGAEAQRTLDAAIAEFEKKRTVKH